MADKNNKVRFQFDADRELAEAIYRLQRETGHKTFAAVAREAIGWYGDTHILTLRYGAPIFYEAEDIAPHAFRIPVGTFPKLSLRWDALNKTLDYIDSRR